MYMPHFMYPFICQGTFGLFSLVAIVNSAAVDTQHIYEYISKLGLLDQMVFLFFYFNF